MKALFYIAVGWVLLVLQSTAVSYTLAGLPQPDLLLVLMVFIGFSAPVQVGLPVALALGYLLDLFVGGITGAYLFQYATLFFIAHALRGRLLMSVRVVQVAVVFTMTVLGFVELTLAARLFQVPEAAVGAGGLGVLARGALNAGIALLMFPLLMAVERRLWPRAGRLSLQVK